MSDTYEEWVATVPAEIAGDALWRMKVYRLALYVSELGWEDTRTLLRDRRTADIAGQMHRAIASIGANLAEGYSRSGGKDRARFYEYALGSAREARDWYYKARHVLGDDIAFKRLQVLTEILRLLLKIVPQERMYSLREDPPDYGMSES